jgi:hypothetical protein
MGGAALYTVLYVALGSATWPFVRDYYRNPQHGLALCVPTGRVIIGLQMARGLATTIVLTPLMAAAPTPDAAWRVRLSLLLVAVMAIGPLIMATRWPRRLRWIHAIEISAFAVLYSFTICSLIARPYMSA